MANYTNFSIDLSGDLLTINSLKSDIDKYVNEDYIEIGDNGGYIEEYYTTQLDNGNVNLILTGMGRWAAPVGDIADIILDKNYKVTGILSDVSEESDFIYVIEFENGGIIREESDEYYSDITAEYIGLYTLFENADVWFCNEIDINFLEKIYNFFNKYKEFDLSEWKAHIDCIKKDTKDT